MKNFTLSLKNLLTYSLSSILLFSCSTDENELEANQELSSTSSSALTLSNNDVIALKSTGGYLSADDTYLIFKGSSASDDGEKYTIINHGSDVISLISLKTGKYVSSEFTRSYGMTANRTTAAAWEKFDVHYLGGDVIALSNTYKGTTKYMCSEGGREDAAFSRSNVGGAWEKFTIEKINESNDDSSSFINTNDGSFDLSLYDIESSSHLSSSTSTSTTTESDATDTSVFDEWFTSSNGDYYLKSASHDGKRTEWKENGQSSLYDDKTLKYEASVTDIPENGVTIAQLHNRGSGVKRPYIRVFIDNDRKIKIKETTNDLTNSSGQWDETPDEDTLPYTAGDKFKVQLTVDNGTLNVKVETNDGTLEQDFTPNVTNNDYDDTYYFKAGVYTEGDDTEPVIRFYSFED